MKWTEAYEHSGWTIAVPVKLIHAIGAKGAILVAQLFYWKGRERTEGGWIYKTKNELIKETGLSIKEQRKCVDDLKKSKILETRYDRLEHRLEYRISNEVLDAIMEGDSPGDLPKRQMLQAAAQKADGTCPKGRWPNAQKADRHIKQRIRSENTAETTTTAARSPAVNGNGVAHKVVVVSSLPSADEDPAEITDKLIAEFGEFCQADVRKIADQVTLSRGYVLDAAEGARAYAGSHRVKNRAGLFMQALREGWKPPKASAPVKRQKVQRTNKDPLKELNTEGDLAQTEARLERAKARWIQADADQRFAWLERMDAFSRKLAPINGSEPRRGFVLCLAAIQEE